MKRDLAKAFKKKWKERKIKENSENLSNSRGKTEFALQTEKRKGISPFEIEQRPSKTDKSLLEKSADKEMERQWKTEKEKATNEFLNSLIS